MPSTRPLRMRNLQRSPNATGMRLKIASMKSKPEKRSSLANKRARPELSSRSVTTVNQYTIAVQLSVGPKGPRPRALRATRRISKKEDLSAALLQDLTTQRTAALRAALSVRPEIALIAITHNLAAQIFYDQTYLLPSSLTVRTDAHADGFDLRSAAESEAAKAITEQTKDVRNLLPPKLELLWDWALEQAPNVLLKVLAVAVAHTVNAVQSPHDGASTGRKREASLTARPDLRTKCNPSSA